MEPAEAQQHYCEKLIRLADLSVYCEPIKPPLPARQNEPRSECGHRYWCAGLCSNICRNRSCHSRTARGSPRLSVRVHRISPRDRDRTCIAALEAFLDQAARSGRAR